MQSESLDELKAAFEEWRSRKRHPREAIPAALLERARRMIPVYGPMAVSRATKVDRSRLAAGRSPAKAGSSSRQVPAYSRVEIAAPVVTDTPFAEVVTPTGIKLRLFTQSAEAFEWLSSVCGAGDAR